MARQERNNVDYFPHNVTHGKKMFYLRSKFKNDGYAVWFMLLEQLGKADYHYLNLSDEIQLMYLSSEFMVSEEMLSDIINILVKFGDFDADLWNNHKVLYNEKFVQNISDAYKKRNNECVSISNLYSLLGFPYKPLSSPKPEISTLKVDGSTQSKVKYIKEDKTILDKSKEKEKSANAPPDKLKNDEPKISVSEQKKTEQQKKAIAAAKLSFETSNCQFSNEFKKIWIQLCEMPKWLKKPSSAILASLKNVMDYPEDYAIELCKICIANDNQGLTFSDTKIKYENQQKIKQNGQFNTHKPASIYQPEHVKRANERDAWEAKALQILATKHNQNTDSQLLIE